MPVKKRVSVFGFIIKKHGVNIAVNVTAIVSVHDFLISFIRRESIFKALCASNFIQSGRVVIRSHACQINMRFDFIFGYNQFHWETTDNVVGRLRVYQPLMIARQIRDNINFSAVQLVEQVSPIVEDNVLKIARNVIFKELHVFVTVAHNVLRSVFGHESRIDNVADFQSAVIFFGSCKKFGADIFRHRRTFCAYNICC